MVGEAHTQCQLKEEPRSCLLGLCVHGAHIVEWHNCGVPPASGKEKSQFLLQELHSQWWFTGAPRSCLIGRWAQGACMLEWHYCGNWMPSARSVSCSSSERPPTREVGSEGLSTESIGMTAVSRSQQLGRGKSQFLLLGPCILGWICASPVVDHRNIRLPSSMVADLGAPC